MKVTMLLSGALLAATAAFHVPSVMADGAFGLAQGYPENWLALDSREVALLPPYCPYTQLYRLTVKGGHVHEQIEHWTAIMGKTFHAMHHYCHGLLKTNRALLLATNEKTRKFYLDSSIGEFDYVINRAPPDFVMLPEIYTKKGENLLRLGREVEAMQALKKAMSLKTDYWPPYAVLADYYKEHGNAAQARTVLEKGLEHMPDAEPLKRRLAETARASK
jgi:tetratricopeptide (TPR) repeat protein